MHYKAQQNAKMTTLNPASIPKLRGQEDYFTWQMNISAIFLILNLSSTIAPRSPATATTSNATPDPIPCLAILPSGITTTTLLSEREHAALNLLIAKKKDWEVERAKQDAEEKRKNEVALGWIFLTMEPTLAREVLELCSTKRRADGGFRVAELRELEARGVWEKLRARYSG